MRDTVRELVTDARDADDRQALVGRARSRTSSSPVFGELGLLGPSLHRLRLRRDHADARTA